MDVQIYPLAERLIIDSFHQLYYAKWKQTLDVSWMGWRANKCPLDLWIYQEILFETKPTLIIETGTFLGGSAMYLSSMCDMMGRGRVVSIDIRRPDPAPAHPRLTLMTASSTDPAVVAALRQQVTAGDRVMVILDSDHSAAHVEAELEAYAPLVTPGCYMIVEDSNISGHPVRNPDDTDAPGPFEAIVAFKGRHPEFRIDLARERFLLTMNPRGYLKRV